MPRRSKETSAGLSVPVAVMAPRGSRLTGFFWQAAKRRLEKVKKASIFFIRGMDYTILSFLFLREKKERNKARAPIEARLHFGCRFSRSECSVRL